MADAFTIALRAIMDGLYGQSDSVQEAVYSPQGGDPIPWKVFYDENTLMQPSAYSAEVYALGRTVKGILEDLGVDPQRGDSITVKGNTYTVKEPILENNGRAVRLVIS
ncbi:MAG: hypothetical protein JXI32_01860 [Deltaproteobacteria bacterium]|nr:hypothetical protein [Deltaproteobacteria bacterium]